MIRAFIAAEISEATRSNLAELLVKLKRADANVKWVRPSAIHLTLRFLGNIRDDEVDVVAEAMAVAGAGVAPVEVEVGGWGSFPPQKRPRVLWVGLRKGAPELTAVFERLEAALIERDLGAADKRFSPHLTLGRVKSGQGLDRVLKILESATEGSFGSYQVDRLLLIKSELKPTGAIYTVLRESKFS